MEIYIGKLCKKAEWKMYQDVFLPISEELCIDDPDDLSKVFWVMWPEKIDSDPASLNQIIPNCNAANNDTYKRAIKTVSRSAIHSACFITSLFSLEKYLHKIHEILEINKLLIQKDSQDGG